MEQIPWAGGIAPGGRPFSGAHHVDVAPPLVPGGRRAHRRSRLLVIRRGGFNLDFEEAQYWLWAQAPAWGYCTKPPMVAWLIAATTGVCGDAEPCVRLASPLLQGATAFVLGALGSEVGGSALGVWSTVIYAMLPGVALSSVLITTDVPLLLYWAVALLCSCGCSTPTAGRGRRSAALRSGPAC